LTKLAEASLGQTMLMFPKTMSKINNLEDTWATPNIVGLTFSRRTLIDNAIVKGMKSMNKSSINIVIGSVTIDEPNATRAMRGIDMVTAMADTRMTAAERNVYPIDVVVQTVVEIAGIEVLRRISPVVASASPLSTIRDMIQATVGIKKQLNKAPKLTLPRFFFASLTSWGSIVKPTKKMQKAINHFREPLKN